MLGALCFITLFGALAPEKLSPTITSAAIYPTGFALVTREARIDSGEREYVFEEMPNALDGTFWITGVGAAVDATITTLRYEPRKFIRKVTNPYELITANSGRKTTVTFTEGSRQRTMTGTLVGIAPMPFQSLVIKENGQRFRFIPISSVQGMDTTGFVTETEVEVEAPIQEIRLKTRASSPGLVRILSLEPGAIWVQSYLVDLRTNTEADVSSKLQIGMAGLRFKETNLQLVAGKPVMGNTSKYDLASGMGSIQAYMRKSQAYFRRFGEEADPYDRYQSAVSSLERMLAQQAQPYVSGYGVGGYGGGGFGGGGFGSGDSAAYQMPPESPTTTPERVEELFKFDLGRISLEPGERFTRSLFSIQSEHSTFFRVVLTQPHLAAQIDGKRSLSVTRMLRIENKSGHPWTRGLCMLIRDGIMFARSEMPFTAPGKHADLALGTPEDIEASWIATETRRETVSDPFSRSVRRSRIEVAADLTIVNNRREAIVMEVVAEVYGEVTDPGGGTVVVSGFDPSALNRRSTIKWRLSVPAESTHALQFAFRTVL